MLVLLAYLWKRTRPSRIASLAVSAYMACGIVFYTQSNEAFLPVDAAYFSMVTMSTVGYGDLSPSTAGGKAFTVIFIFIGMVGVFPLLAAGMGSLLFPFFNWQRAQLEKLLPETPIDIDGNGRPDFKLPRHPVIFYSKGLIIPLLSTLIVQCIFAAAFVYIEEWG